MKKNYIFAGILVGSVSLLSFQSNFKNEQLTAYYKSSHFINTSGSQAGRTGAPGESTCTSCHSGTVQSGAGFNQVIFTDGANAVTTYTPGQTYTVGVGMLTNNPKNGFQIVALGANDAQAGTITITDATNTQLLNGAAGKKYVTHKAAGTTLNTWSFQWTAPAVDAGTVTFYLATNQSNSNSGSGGDIIRTSQHSLGSTASIGENNQTVNASIGYASNSNSLIIDLDALNNGTASLNLVDLSGKSVQFENLGAVASGENNFQMKLSSELPKGVYMAHLSVNNTFVTKKIFID